MKHTKNYMDAMWVIENPEKYDNKDVIRAYSFIEAYNEGYNKALSLGGDVGRSEQSISLTRELIPNDYSRCNNDNCDLRFDCARWVQLQKDKEAVPVTRFNELDCKSYIEI